METVEKFQVGVDDTGLPKGWCVGRSMMHESIQGLNASEVTKIFWMLRSMTVSYAYAIDGVQYSNTLTMNCRMKPLERLAADPKFSALREVDGIESWATLQIENIARHQTQMDSYNLNLLIHEGDRDHKWLLSTQRTKDRKVLSEVKQRVFGKPVMVYLYGGDNAKKGSITDVRIKMRYFQVSE